LLSKVKRLGPKIKNGWELPHFFDKVGWKGKRRGGKRQVLQKKKGCGPLVPGPFGGLIA